MMKWKKKSKILKLLWNRLFKYGWYKQKNVWKNGTKIIADNDGILWSNEKQMKQGLEHKNLLEITTKYHLSHKKHRYELVDEPKKQSNWIFMDEKVAIKVIMDFRATAAHEFRTIQCHFNKRTISANKNENI